MKAKKLAEILLKNPESKVTLSVSNDKLHLFANEIIEITKQGEKQLTIVGDINENNAICDINCNFMELEKLYEEIEEHCGTLAISHDSPDIETIKEWFQKYEKIKISLNAASSINISFK